MKVTNSAEKKNTVTGKILSVIVTFLFTNLCWIFFRAESIGKALTIIQRILSFDQGISQPYMWFFVSSILLISAIIVALLKSKDNLSKISKRNISFVEGYYPLVKLESFWGLVIFFVFCGLILCWAYTGGSPFIYGTY